MGRKKADVTVLTGDGQEILMGAFEKFLQGEKPKVIIIAAEIKDGYCNYSYRNNDGINEGDKHEVKGTRVVHGDMRQAFNRLNVHLACVDDVFKHAGIEFDQIDEMHGHDLAGLFDVSWFEIKGDIDDESIILGGNKYVSLGSWMDTHTPKVTLDKASSYKWFAELKMASDDARLEVYRYCVEGRCTPDEEERDEKAKKRVRQLKITDTEGAASPADNMADFENASV